uniref:Uncharacterized protein n=1 Tax=Arundo donax TaxID=35708 RepID=A0A0A9FDA3_ARUDO
MHFSICCSLKQDCKFPLQFIADDYTFIFF